VSDSLEPKAVGTYLHGRLGTPYLYEAECESTQLLLLGTDLPEGAVAATDHQTGGRGRLGRRWEAQPRSSLLLSVLLRPPAERRLPELSLVAALAAAEAAELATGLTAQIKWPNDVMVNRRKVAGILSELADGAVVVGIGMNVNQTRAELPVDVTTPAGSLRMFTGKELDRAAVLGTLLERLELAYDAWGESGLDAIYGEVGARDFLRGRRLTVEGEDARGVQIQRDGRLRVETAGGDERVLESGEVLFAA
jgi:BirA family transcriptional regulator, biotin operon repressor / biotin---[acetyl-CoA-carboxylase] ligase